MNIEELHFLQTWMPAPVALVHLFVHPNKLRSSQQHHHGRFRHTTHEKKNWIRCYGTLCTTTTHEKVFRRNDYQLNSTRIPYVAGINNRGRRIITPVARGLLQESSLHLRQRQLCRYVFVIFFFKSNCKNLFVYCLINILFYFSSTPITVQHHHRRFVL